MKIIQFNVWNGRIKDGLSRFIAEGDYDVVCMQEAMWGSEDGGFLRDLTAIHQIKSTLMPARYTFDVPCDHILISDDINYRDFKTLDTIASDHKALSVEVLTD